MSDMRETGWSQEQGSLGHLAELRSLFACATLLLHSAGQQPELQPAGHGRYVLYFLDVQPMLSQLQL